MVTPASDALRAAAVFGAYFAVGERSGGGWMSLADLAADETALRKRVAATRRVLAEERGRPAELIENRAAASIWFLGFVARVISPPFGAAALSGSLPRLTPEGTHTRLAGPIAVDVDADAVPAGAGDDRASALHDQVFGEVVAPLVVAVDATFALSRQVLWGNAASSLVGAAVVVGAVRPDLAGAATELARRTLAGDLLAGAGQLGAGPIASSGDFRRSNCCLYYRLPGGGVCADCVLGTGPG